FAVMYLLLLGFVFLYIRRISRAPEKSLTFAHDSELRGGFGGNDVAAPEGGGNRVKLTYIVFLLVSLALIVICSSLSALRGYTVVVLTAYFLIFGIVAGIVASKQPRTVLKSFLNGLLGALPTLVFIALAASIKYIFDEGRVLPTIVNQINKMAAGRHIVTVALIIYLIVLALEFFISSSTAKAVLVMGLLSVVNVGLSKQMLVLLYTFADGYTNVIFPTSPVLLIALSMIGVDYFKWVKKSLPLFAVNAALVVAFILLGIFIGY
ncbi:MAG: hypothetical protein II184_00815, partial [Clostridia bacterium]|nr:hypothetical protein [Clostridia bacterium]